MLIYIKTQNYSQHYQQMRRFIKLGRKKYCLKNLLSSSYSDSGIRSTLFVSLPWIAFISSPSNSIRMIILFLFHTEEYSDSHPKDEDIIRLKNRWWVWQIRAWFFIGFAKCSCWRASGFQKKSKSYNNLCVETGCVNVEYMSQGLNRFSEYERF